MDDKPEEPVSPEVAVFHADFSGKPKRDRTVYMREYMRAYRAKLRERADG